MQFVVAGCPFCASRKVLCEEDTHNRWQSILLFLFLTLLFSFVSIERTRDEDHDVYDSMGSRTGCLVTGKVFVLLFLDRSLLLLYKNKSIERTHGEEGISSMAALRGSRPHEEGVQHHAAGLATW